MDVPSGRRWTYTEFDDAVDEVARGLLARGIDKGDRVGIWAPNCAEWVITQYATAKVGAILVNVNPAYRTHELAYVVRQSGLRLLDQRGRVQDQRLPRHDQGDRLHRDDLHRHAGLGGPGRRGAGKIAGGAGRDARLRRPDQHPVHVGDDGLPERRDPVAPQHREQRLLRRRTGRLHRAGSDLHPGPALSLLRHGDGQPGSDHPRRVHGPAGPRLRPGGDAAGGQRAEMHFPVRRPDHVHRRAGSAGLRRLRPVVACAPASWRARRARWR